MPMAPMERPLEMSTFNVVGPPMISSRETAEGRCWGSELKALLGGQEGCDPAFTPGLAHLKNKFCRRWAG